VTLSTDVSSTRAGLGGSFDFHGQVSGSAARSDKLAVITAADATMAPMTMGRFIILSLEVL
jgi:autotransporter translocation and assembly factor TamB